MIRSRMSKLLGFAMAGVLAVLMPAALVPAASAMGATPSAPSPRVGMEMADDAARGQMVLFGGCCEDGADYFGDTWTWNGTDWTHVHPAHAPPRRAWMGAAY